MASSKLAGKPNTSLWTIRCKSGHEGLGFHRPFDGDAITLTRHMQTTLRQSTCTPEPPIALLEGRWSSNLTSNFVLTFAGTPAFHLVRQHKKAFLGLFGDSFQLVPCTGYVRLLMAGVPCIRNAQGVLAPLIHVAREIGQNVHFRGVQILDGPTWFHMASEEPSMDTSSISLVIYDPTGKKARELVKHHTYLYAKRINVRVATNSQPFRQCTRCHWLTHTADCCARPESFK
jgi:hypothetical protein